MSLVPEWAPNVHPMLVHFPIAVLFLAVAFDAAALVLRRWPSWRYAAAALYALGAIAAIVSFYTGRDAASGVLLPTDANAVLTDHADWALRTVWFYGLLAAARLAIAWGGWGRHPVVHGGLLIAGAAGLILVYETGEHGAEMVFRYGVGVQAAKVTSGERHRHEVHESEEADEAGHSSAPAEAGPHGEGEAGGHEHEAAETHSDQAHARAEGGTGGFRETERGWAWTPGHDAPKVFRARFEVFEGTWGDVALSGADDAEAGDVLKVSPAGTTIGLRTEAALGDVQVDLEVNLEAFDGAIRLLHNISGERSYGFLSVSNDGTALLGRMTPSGPDTLEVTRTRTKGFVSLRLVSDGRHFRGYVGGKLAVHGHASSLPDGPVGLAIEGSGTVVLRSMSVTPLR